MTDIDIDITPNGWTESEKSDVLQSCRALSVPVAEGLADIVRMAADTWKAPVAVLALKSRRGLALAADVGLLKKKTASWETTKILAFLDEELSRDQLVPGDAPFPASLAETELQAYFGTVLRTPDGHPIGTLGVFDRVAREFTATQPNMLDFLARQTVSLLETGRSWAQQSRLLEENRSADLRKLKFEWLSEQSPDLVGMIDFAGYFPFLNNSGKELLGLRPGGSNPYTLDDFIAEEDLDIYRDEIRPVLRRGESCERRLRIRKLGSKDPLPALFTIFPLRAKEGRIVGYGIRSKDVTDQEAEERRREHLIREGHHRVQNMVALINSIVSLTIRNSGSLADAAKSVRSRLDALGSAQTVLGAASSAMIEDVVKAALRALDFGRIDISGPSLLLSAEQVQGVSLLLYELATNAVKYGSLSNDEGCVAVSWSVSEGRAFTFRWKETGGPTVAIPSSQGFGSTLVTRGVGQYFDGEVDQEFLPEGVQVRLRGWLKAANASGND